MFSCSGDLILAPPMCNAPVPDVVQRRPELQWPAEVVLSTKWRPQGSVPAEHLRGPGHDMSVSQMVQGIEELLEESRALDDAPPTTPVKPRPESYVPQGPSNGIASGQIFVGKDAQPLRNSNRQSPASCQFGST